MINTPIANRKRISFFGKRNAGKSTLMNAFTNQSISIVSPVPGTTTDAVSKTMELLPIGPIIVTDTAGYDDFGELGTHRVGKTYDVLRKTDFAIHVIGEADGVKDIDREFVKNLKMRDIPCVVVINKVNEEGILDESITAETAELGFEVVEVNALSGRGIDDLKAAVIKNMSGAGKESGLLDGLVNEKDIVVLVTPMDDSAPKGRIILPQQQVLRECLNHHAVSIVVQVEELPDVLKRCTPKMVITDSQAFSKVSEIVPEDIILTSFSILFARQKGEMKTLLSGVKSMKNMGGNKNVLISEGCSHHRQKGDIGTDKIPLLIAKVFNTELETLHFSWTNGGSFPQDCSKYDAIVHCGGCMLSKKEMQSRIYDSGVIHIPITNYGMIIAQANGILDRATKNIL